MQTLSHQKIQTSSSENPKPSFASAHVRADSVLNAVTIPQKQEITSSRSNFAELNTPHITGRSMREPVASNSISITAPVVVRKMNLPEESIRAQENWAKAFSAIRQIVKGAFKDCLVLAERYYLEALDPLHEYSNAHYENLEDWQSHPQYQSFSYFQFLDRHRRSIIPGTDVCRGKLMVEDPFHYVSVLGSNNVVNQERLEKSWIYTGADDGNYLASGVDQFTAEESERRFGVLIEGQEVLMSPNYHAAWKQHIESSQRPLELIFVTDKEGKMYAGFKEKGMFQHSSFLSGAPVAMAGTLIIGPKGRLQGVSNLSGHYNPTENHSIQFLHQLRQNGVNLNNLDFTSAKPDGEDFNVFRGKAADWLRENSRQDQLHYGVQQEVKLQFEV